MTQYYGERRPGNCNTCALAIMTKYLAYCLNYLLFSVPVSPVLAQRNGISKWGSGELRRMDRDLPTNLHPVIESWDSCTLPAVDTHRQGPIVDGLESGFPCSPQAMLGFRKYEDRVCQK